MREKVAIAAFLTFAVAPLVAGFGYALLYSLGVIGALGKGFTLGYWQKTLADVPFWSSILLSALVAALVCLLSVALALGWLLYARKQLEMDKVRFVLHWPLALPALIAAFFSFQWLGSSGILARVAFQMGWIEGAEGFPELINDPNYFGVIFTLTLLTFPFFLLLFMDYFHSARLPDLSSLAATLGASGAYIQRKLLVPILLRRAMPAVLLYFVFLLGAYEVPLLLGRQSPAMLSVFISLKFSKYNLDDLPVAYVATVIYTAVVVLLVLILLRRSASQHITHA